MDFPVFLYLNSFNGYFTVGLGINASYFLVTLKPPRLDRKFYFFSGIGFLLGVSKGVVIYWFECQEMFFVSIYKARAKAAISFHQRDDYRTWAKPGHRNCSLLIFLI